MPRSSETRRATLRASFLQMRQEGDFSEEDERYAIVATPPQRIQLSRYVGQTFRRKRRAELVDVYLSGVPVHMICRDIQWSILVHFCSTTILAKYTAKRPEKKKCLLVQVYNSKSAEPFAQSLNEDLVTLCCTERALHVFGLDKEQEALRAYIERKCLATSSVKKLRPVWEHVPRGTYWSDRVLDCVQEGLKYMDCCNDKFGRCYCKSLDPSYAAHENCLGAWVVTDKSLSKALGMYRNSRGPTTHTRFGIRRFSSKLRTSEWILSVESADKVRSFGADGTPELPVDIVNRKVSVKKTCCLLPTSYQLEWIDEDGGYYLETIGDCHPSPELDTDAIEPTSVSREWLASRGHRGGGGGTLSREEEMEALVQHRKWQAGEAQTQTPSPSISNTHPSLATLENNTPPPALDAPSLFHSSPPPAPARERETGWGGGWPVHPLPRRDLAWVS
ncbi:predicted protein [Plenodomus lingam JN3]|uniref:Predicted protein n=1 Tax=Leptosphaeria maculans (strain JN3 / isolate v23.1.3 / race Av1-4-5-6-7-8) TaxID=985895 RepID=E5A0J6_LEPMJ|nr:predicted protein [Plenodomus lingam JN3]CBX97056.1 predicted protein [Plenodomus lingam JN3]